MNDNQKLVLHGLLALPEAEAEDVLQEYEKTKKQSKEERVRLSQSIEKSVKVYGGPSSAVGTTCPCCDR